MIGRMLMTLTGLILGMLGLITAIHSDHFVLGVLLLFGGVWAMHEGLPNAK
jgi:putative Mn2+ efflux pump MntP